MPLSACPLARPYAGTQARTNKQAGRSTMSPMAHRISGRGIKISQ